VKRLIPAVGAIVLLGAACAGPATPSPTVPTPPPTTPTTGGTIKQWSQPPPMTIDPSRQYVATLHTSMGDITAELFAGEAPKTVNNFVFLAREGFYNGIRFHRIVKGFMIQTGDPKGDGTGGPGYRFDDEPVKRRYERGVLAMANAGPNTNGSQFFIMHADYPLPPNYTIFGRVTSGLEVVDQIASVKVRPNPRMNGEPSLPTVDIRILSIDITEQ